MLYHMLSRTETNICDCSIYVKLHNVQVYYSFPDIVSANKTIEVLSSGEHMFENGWLLTLIESPSFMPNTPYGYPTTKKF